MMRLRVLLVLVPLLCGGFSIAQTGPDKKDGKDEKAEKKASNEVEVKFADASTVRMVILQESVDIVTKFGKLTVPMSEVRRVELGVHLAEGVPDKIQAALKKLNSEIFKERDEAVNDLVTLGPAAYPTLLASSKSTNPEISQRVQMALKRIKAKYPADSLRTAVNDRIITNDFPIVGRIVSPTIKAKTPIFGQLDLKLTELRTISWMSGNNDVEISLDASKYCSRTQWMDTGVTVESGGGLHIHASGEIDLWPGQGPVYLSGPQGNFNVGGRFGPGNNWIPGLLIAKIGEAGPTFTVGERYQNIPSVEGKVYLQVVPGNWGGNIVPQGAYKVKISSGLHVR